MPFYQTDYNQLIIIESDGFNNTLAPFSTCNNSNVESIGDFGDSLVDDFIDSSLTPTLKRIQPLVKGLNLTTSDLNAMQQLCAYEVRAVIGLIIPADTSCALSTDRGSGIFCIL